MTLPVAKQLRYWGIAGIVFFVALWGLGNVILPFVLGGALAYFMDPVADRLERAGLSRAAATAAISIIAVLVFVLLALLVIPTLARQLGQLINTAPQILTQLQAFLVAHFPQIMDNQSVVNDTLTRIGEAITSQGGALATGLLTSAMSLINTVIFMVVVPVVAFYLLLDWDKMVARIDTWLPRDHAPVIRGLADEVDTVLAGFVRGQVSVCLILGAFYSVGLMLAGLQYGLVIGVIAGLISFIPYVGTVIGGGLAIGLALFQFWGDWLQIGIVFGIFALGQFLEGNFITPRLVGKSVGLHPVWLLFALSAFGTLFGFVGMLVAVPVAAALGVLARFLMGQYLESRLYHGTSREEEEAQDALAAAPPEPPAKAQPKAARKTPARRKAAAAGRNQGQSAGRSGR